MSTTASKAKGLIWLIAVIGLAAAFSLGLPFVASFTPWSVERGLARWLGNPVAGSSCDRNAAGSSALQAVVGRLYPIYPGDSRFPLSIQIIPGPTVNAFAYLGGKIYVYEGLLKLAESPEELAGVLAHELEHVRRRHIIQGVVVRLFTVEGLRMVFEGLGGMDPTGSDTASQLLNLGFSREQEASADHGGLQRLKDGQIDVDGFGRFFERAETSPLLPTFLSDHPANSQRAEWVKAVRGGPTRPLLTSAQWQALQGICRPSR